MKISKLLCNNIVQERCRESKRYFPCCDSRYVQWIFFILKRLNSLLLRCMWRRISSPSLDLLLGSLAVFYYQDAFIFASAWQAFYIWKWLSCYLASLGITSQWQAFDSCIVLWLNRLKTERVCSQITVAKQIHGRLNSVWVSIVW